MQAERVDAMRTALTRKFEIQVGGKPRSTQQGTPRAERLEPKLVLSDRGAVARLKHNMTIAPFSKIQSALGECV